MLETLREVHTPQIFAFGPHRRRRELTDTDGTTSSRRRTRSGNALTMPANDPGSDFEYNANSFLRSPPSTPSNHSRPLLKGHSSPASLTSFAHLTPSSSAAELASNPHSRVHYLPSPSFSFDHKRTRSRTGLLPPSRTHFLPVQSSLQAQTLIVRPGSPQFALDMSRTSSPTRRSRALSPGRGDRITRPQSRCESLLRDTLKRDEHERYRNASRSPGRWNERKPRARGNSFLAALKAEDSCGSDDERDENIFHHGSSSKNTHVYFTRSPHLTVHARTSRGHGVGYPTSPSDDGIHYPYGSPSSPSPPSMLRTRTAPVLHAKASTTFENDRSSATSKSSPRAERRSLPLTSMHSHDASPKQQHGSLTPHESILRAKLEYVLQRSGPEETKPMGRRRNHHRAQTQGVTINTGVMKPTQENAITPSPQVS